MQQAKILYPSRLSPLPRLNRLLKSSHYANAKYVILLDENTYTHCLPYLVSRMRVLEEAEFLVVPVGEEAKSIEIASQLWGALLDMKADRNTIIVNLGGGCISDLGGYVAACYKRGIRFINIPTTLIGMVDAAIGGKTAVNIEGYKNQVGLFAQPDFIAIDPTFLDTLPAEEVSNGLFEILKTLMLSNSDIYHSVCQLIQSNSLVLNTEMVVQCTRFKSNVVKYDPFDKSARKILNLGHTFGHAFESFHKSINSPLSHGKAVGLGMWCALYLSKFKLGMSPSLLEEYQNTMLSIVKPHPYTLKDTETILSYMRADKKNVDGMILCVLLQSLGLPLIDVPVDENEIRDTILSLAKLQ
ncbi:MAG: 3-dehydroquinate synthase [Bacteroidales bacterium]|nr:3-dehydroquinate synthase [Bacteroidales bacterium]